MMVVRGIDSLIGARAHPPFDHAYLADASGRPNSARNAQI
jgi:hypothetical protein